jgi:hypothetical protein
VLLRLAYLGVTNAVALLRLLPMSDRDKDAEILVLRHQIAVLQPIAGSSDRRPAIVKIVRNDDRICRCWTRSLPREESRDGDSLRSARGFDVRTSSRDRVDDVRGGC